MDIVARLNDLEDKYPDLEIEGAKAALIEDLSALHQEAMNDRDDLSRFTVQAAERFGGAYIPYLFWDRLALFFDDPFERDYLFQLISALASSNFEEEEQRLMKPLLITYFAVEKEFERDKIHAQIADKAHPAVRDYLIKLFTFVEKNQRATDMYREKFEMLRSLLPSFDLLQMPITQLREQLEGV